MKYSKKTLAVGGGIAGAAVLAVSLAACTAGGSVSAGQQQENRQQSADTNSLEANQPIPHFNYSQIRQTLIDAETISADGTQTTSFFFQMGNQDPVYSCPSLGEPVANSASLSNPSQAQWNTSGTNTVASAVTGQMDPDGVYAPSSSSGTYVICIGSSGKKYLQYWEGNVLTVSAGAEWDESTHSVKVTGAPTAAVHTKPGK